MLFQVVTDILEYHGINDGSHAPIYSSAVSPSIASGTIESCSPPSNHYSHKKEKGQANKRKKVDEVDEIQERWILTVEQSKQAHMIGFMYLRLLFAKSENRKKVGSHRILNHD